MRGGANPHRGVGLDGDAAAPRLDDEQRRALTLQVGGDHEQLAVARPGDQRLDAVQLVAAPGGAGLGLQREGIEQWLGLHHRQRRGRNVLPDERRQVGRLLLGVAPQAQRGRDRGRRQAGDGDPHVAVGQRLAHQDRGRGGALVDGAPELLGDADHRQSELVGLREQLGGGGAALVGRRRRRRGSRPARTRARSRAAAAARRWARGRTGPRGVRALDAPAARGAERRRTCGRRARRSGRSSWTPGEGGAGSGRAARAGRSRSTRRRMLSARSPTAMPRSARLRLRAIDVTVSCNVVQCNDQRALPGRLTSALARTLLWSSYVPRVMLTACAC